MLKKIYVIAHPDTGAVVTPTANPEFGSIRVDQEIVEVATGGFLRTSKRVAFVKGPLAQLEALDLKAGEEFPMEGKIVVRESTKPFYDGQQPKLVPDTNVSCKLNGTPIYRQTEFTTDLATKDTLVAHNNQEEIKAAQAVAMPAAGNIGAN